MSANATSARTRLTLGGVAAATFGLALFIYTVHQTGFDTIIDGIRRVGVWFLAILLLSGLRYLARARAWSLCSEDPRALRVRDTFPAIVSGDALGNLTPLGLIVSEPTKAAFVRHRVSLMTALAGIAVENLFYTWSVAVVIVGGSVALLFSVDVPATLRAVSLVALGAMVAFMLITLTMIGGDVRLISRTLAWLDQRDLCPARLRDRLDKLRALEARIYGFNRHHPNRTLPVLLLEGAYHAAGVAEVWLTLKLLMSIPATRGELDLGGASGAMATIATPSLLTAFLLESVNRLINVVFKFVPLRLGVDEAGTGLLAQVLGLTTATGVTLAIVRKARMLTWTAVGVAFIARRGLAPMRAAEEVERLEVRS
ncbi:MAG: hypothetical protein GEU99_22905 [Luteitalea sp.]|nr:hypothetical protein [Luteitalea sp.]